MGLAVAACWPCHLGADESLSLAHASAVSPVPLIIDTDIGGGACRDVDDVAAICMANAMADNGEVELLAVMQNTEPAQCSGMISVLNHYYGRDDVPIGAFKGAGLAPSRILSYVADIGENWPSPIKNASEVPSSVDVYRRVLVVQPDHSVVISSIGLLTNLEALLRSGPDGHSPLDGRELVARKVRLLAVMGGRYPTSGDQPECNFCGCAWNADKTSAATAAAASAYVVSHMPSSVKMVFSGVEVGREVHTGAVLSTCSPRHNPCRQAFMDYSRDNRNYWTKGLGAASFDPLTVLVAVRGAGPAQGVVECEGCDGTNDIRNGGNAWLPSVASNQTYLVLRDANVTAAAINELLCQPPRASQLASFVP
mmetsp:Transcript_55366/g.154214  ORF Transcript_55366/g.154214 Transcript_55366/m.154214 type:complete len:367 (-) Transcript_55366:65-1165(-)